MTSVGRALQLWGLDGARVTFVAARENTVYRIDHALGRFALRLHRQGYRTDEQLGAELEWTAMLGKTGLSIPAPLRSLAGKHLQIAEGIQVDVLTWLDGETLDNVLPELGATARRDLFQLLGQSMARLHEASDHWPGAETCDRPAWDASGLLGDAPLWGKFWENPGLTEGQKALLNEFRTTAANDLKTYSPTLDQGLIHADLVPGNVMVSGETLHLIDFDDGGFGFRLFEIATALLKHRKAEDFPDLKDAVLSGYTSLRPLDIAHLPLFMALRAATYVGWNIARSDEDPSGERNARFIAEAVDLIMEYLNP